MKFTFDWSGFNAVDLAEVNDLRARHDIPEDDIYGCVRFTCDGKPYIGDIHYYYYGSNEQGWDIELYETTDISEHGVWLNGLKKIKSSSEIKRFRNRVEAMIGDYFKAYAIPDGMIKYYLCTDIEWDTDDGEEDTEEPELPTTVIIPVNMQYFEDPDDEVELGETITNALSDRYGWCIYGLDYKRIDPITDAWFKSVFADEAFISASCRVDLGTKRVFDIKHNVQNTDVENDPPVYQCILIDGHKFAVYAEDKRPNEESYYYET